MLTIHGQRGESKVGAHPVGIGPHRESPSTGDPKIGVRRVAQVELVVMGAPDQRVEQAETLRLPRLKRLLRQGDQCARKVEASIGGGRGVAIATDRPNDIGGLDRVENEGPCRAPPMGPIGFMSESERWHRRRKVPQSGDTEPGRDDGTSPHGRIPGPPPILVE